MPHRGKGIDDPVWDFIFTSAHTRLGGTGAITGHHSPDATPTCIGPTLPTQATSMTPSTTSAGDESVDDHPVRQVKAPIGHKDDAGHQHASVRPRARRTIKPAVTIFLPIRPLIPLEHVVNPLEHLRHQGVNQHKAIYDTNLTAHRRRPGQHR